MAMNSRTSYMAREARLLNCVAPQLGQVEHLIDKRSGPGLIVLTVDLELLFLNRRATELCKDFGNSQPVTSSFARLPSPVLDLCSEVRSLLHRKTPESGAEHMQSRRVVTADRRPVLLRGFGLLDKGALEQSLILVILEEVGRRQKLPTEVVKARFGLTDREEAVVLQLAKGLTNKEIARILGITEQTVKEHIRHVMKKTGATTRTGIVAEMLEIQASLP